MPRARGASRYSSIIERIFFDHWQEGTTEFFFERDEIKRAADDLGIELPDNVGDVLYSFRFRANLPARIRATAPEGTAWRIELAGRARYRFALGQESRIVPRHELVETRIPDATPELISLYALDDEQALLAIVRYNRLVDIFLGVTTYSLQNHLRTTVSGVGQIEIDELYVGVDRQGDRYVIPVQAKGGSDQVSIVQTVQDIRACAEKFSSAICRPVSVQFMEGNLIAMFELTEMDGEVRLVDERHYRLVPASDFEREIA
jgi:hypothetical protein